MPRYRSRLLVLFAAATLASPAFAREEPSCSAPLGERPQAAGVSIVPEAPGANDLPSLRVTLEATGHFMRVFFDEVQSGRPGAAPPVWGDSWTSSQRLWATRAGTWSGPRSSSRKTPITFRRADLMTRSDGPS
jgi:hypothetical protein